MIHDDYTIIKLQQNSKNHRLKKKKKPQSSIKNHFSFKKKTNYTKSHLKGEN
jgi:hypothetical protein